MYTGNNPSALRSQEELVQALLALMEQYDFQEITITMICQDAKISRQTFYQLYSDKEDAIRFCIMHSYLEYEQKLLQYKSLSIEQLAEYTFLFFEQHRDFVLLLMKNQLHYLLLEQFQLTLPKILGLFRQSDETVSDDAVLAFLSGGLCSMILFQIGHQTPAQARQSAAAFSKLFGESELVFR